MARVPDRGDRDTRTEFLAQIVFGLARPEGVVLGLKVEERRAPRAPPGRLRRRQPGGPLARVHLRMETLEPRARIVAGGEEGEFQMFEALRVGKRGIGALG